MKPGEGSKYSDYNRELYVKVKIAMLPVSFDKFEYKAYCDEAEKQFCDPILGGKCLKDSSIQAINGDVNIKYEIVYTKFAFPKMV